MIFILGKDNITEDSLENVRNPHHFCVIRFEELKSMAVHLGMPDKAVSDCFRNEISKFESHDGYDFITLNIPDDRDQRKLPHRVCIFFTDNVLVFVNDGYELMDELVNDLQAETFKNLSLGRIISLFFDEVTADDSRVLEKLEQEITGLEEDLTVLNKSEVLDDIIAYRKRLRMLKRYYEQLLEISEGIEQNENGLINKSALRYFKFHTGRVNRLYGSVQNLREYVTQVREAYQAQMDINLNKVMKFFTVITSIFMPLTLIVGWYGMNLKMPEFKWDYGYPFVVALMVVVAIGSLIYFKKNKWF